jgi:ABC-type uncharacterized transport system substrate-binding protein
MARRVFFCLLTLPTITYSQSNILTVVSSYDRLYQDFYSTLEDGLQDDSTIRQISASEIDSETLNQYDLVIPVGYRAAKKVAEYKSKPTVIYSLIPDTESPLNSITCKETNCYKVYINQPIQRYIKLFKKLFSERNTLAVAEIQENSKRMHQIKLISKKYRIKNKAIYIKNDENIARTLINKLSKDDVLLALPNPNIYNKNSAKSIILSAYHKNVPIIAYSEAFAKAGALVSLYSSIDNIANETASVANNIIENGYLTQKEYYPNEFTIKINSTVARSLNIDIAVENDIKRQIK